MPNREKLQEFVVWTQKHLSGDEKGEGDGTPERFIIDFQRRTVIEAQSFPAAFERVKTTVLPDRTAKAEAGKDADGNVRPHHKGFLDRWWALSWDRKEMFAGFRELRGRFIACSRVTKRPMFVFMTTSIWPSDKVQAFLFDDDYSYGILQSSAHWQWFLEKCSKLKSDFSYSIESVFDTFPWPQFDEVGRVTPCAPSDNAKRGAQRTARPTNDAIARIDAAAAAARELRAVRREALPKLKGGLRALYRTLELPGANPLKDAHAALDTAVLTAYGFSAKKDLLAQLLALNQQVATKIENGEPVMPPGVPKNYPDAKKLVTEDCIRPIPI